MDKVGRASRSCFEVSFDVVGVVVFPLLSISSENVLCFVMSRKD